MYSIEIYIKQFDSLIYCLILLFLYKKPSTNGLRCSLNKDPEVPNCFMLKKEYGLMKSMFAAAEGF